MRLIPRAKMPGFSPCTRCGEFTDNFELKAFEDHPKKFYCPACIDKLRAVRAI